MKQQQKPGWLKDIKQKFAIASIFLTISLKLPEIKPSLDLNT